MMDGTGIAQLFAQPTKLLQLPIQNPFKGSRAMMAREKRVLSSRGQSWQRQQGCQTKRFVFIRFSEYRL
jgi:hypothetical protein